MSLASDVAGRVIGYIKVVEIVIAGRDPHHKDAVNSEVPGGVSRARDCFAPLAMTEKERACFVRKQALIEAG